MSANDKHVRIDEKAITIDVIAVDGRAMTPVMFRQLPRRELVDRETTEMQGKPFGLVHYFWGGCKAGSHLHVVWVDNHGRLFRDCIYPTRGLGIHGDATWQAMYDTIRALKQLYIDGDHSDVHA